MNQASVIDTRTPEMPVARLLRDIAHKRASSLIWNTSTLAMFYALLVIIALLRLEEANVFLIMALATFGILVLWIGTRIRWKRIENTFFKQELTKYSQLISDNSGSNEVPAKDEPDAPKVNVPVISQSKSEIDTPLSAREMEVLSLIAEGMMNKQVAVILGISSQTVKNHMAHILEKLNVNDRTSAVLYAVSQGWITIGVAEEKPKLTTGS